jgi:hypothetical protein
MYILVDGYHYSSCGQVILADNLSALLHYWTDCELHLATETEQDRSYNMNTQRMETAKLKKCVSKSLIVIYLPIKQNKALFGFSVISTTIVKVIKKQQIL